MNTKCHEQGQKKGGIIQRIDGPKKEVENIIITYSTRDLTRTDKVRFHYALKGRNETVGFLEQTRGAQLGSAVITVLKQHESLVMSFFKHWKVPIKRRTVIFKDG